MMVWNTTNTPLEYRGKMLLPGNGLEFDMDFIPNRDLKLQANKVLYFGDSLPLWFVLQQQVANAPKPAVQEQTLPQVVVDPATQPPAEKRTSKK
jgi:hypothetical protein